MDWRLCLVLLLTALTCVVWGQDDQMPPKMISTFKNEYYYPRDSILTDASINCKAWNGQIHYEWKRNGVVVPNSQFVSIDGSTGTLKFVKIANEDYGTYQCFATNDYGTSLSKLFKVKESRLGSFPAGDPEEVRCKQFEHCKIQCRDKPICLPDSQCRVQWKIGVGTKSNVYNNIRIGVDGNGDLHIMWTKANDWNGLQYRCGVWQEQRKIFVVGSDTTLRIDPARSIPNSEPISVFKKNGKAMYGGKGVLRCMFSGYPAPDVEWISPTKEVIKDTDGKYAISDFGRVLTISHAEPEYEGFYICKGIIRKVESGPERVFFNVTSAPILTGVNQMRDEIVLVGKKATFRCEAESLPNEEPPTFPIWKKNGVYLVIDGGKYIISENSKLLEVIDVQKGSDTGTYQCMSENSEGVLLKEAILKVIDPITIRERPLGSYKIVLGDVLNLAVVADTDPSLTLQYKWMFTDYQGNEKEIENSEYWKISWPNNNNLTIDVTQVTDPGVVTGVYQLKIYHNYDQKVIYVTIETDIITTENESEVFLPDGQIQLYHMFQNHLGLAFSEK
nr:contactin-1 [Crassostrea gigas]